MLLTASLRSHIPPTLQVHLTFQSPRLRGTADTNIHERSCKHARPNGSTTQLALFLQRLSTARAPCSSLICCAGVMSLQSGLQLLKAQRLCSASTRRQMSSARCKRTSMKADRPWVPHISRCLQLSNAHIDVFMAATGHHQPACLRFSHVLSAEYLTLARCECRQWSFMLHKDFTIPMIPMVRGLACQPSGFS